METRDPKIWGPPFWTVIDTIANAYPINNPPTDVANATNMFFTTLKVLLPCEKCRQHYNDFLSSSPPPLTSRKELTDWVVKLRQSMTPPKETSAPQQHTPQQQKITQQQRIAQQRMARMAKITKPSPIAKPHAYRYAAVNKPAVVTRPAVVAAAAPQSRPIVTPAKPSVRPRVKARGGCNCASRKI